MTLNYFAQNTFTDSLIRFFKDLNVPFTAGAMLPVETERLLGNAYKPESPLQQLIEEVYLLGIVNDAVFMQQNALFADEWTLDRIQAMQENGYKGLLLMGVKLRDNRKPTRTELAELTRLLNRFAKGLPILIVFRYGQYLTLANTERSQYKQHWKEGEKLGKVTLLKDIDILNPHTGHLHILKELSLKDRRQGKDAIVSFEKLYVYWQNVLNVSTLNKRFYDQLFTWYLWAVREVKFPKPATETLADEAYQSVAVIRLLTRLLFVWFVKEKRLIDDMLFDAEALKDHLRDFAPTDANASTYYQAILQNLFFATLNSPMDKDAEHEGEKRQFVEDARQRKGYTDEYLDHTKYRYADLFQDKDKALQLFANIPFLNGGLFECLDSKTKHEEHRYDGFSATASKRACVPNCLFFGKNTLDLSKDLDDKKRSKEAVTGIITLLNSYKFTIAENTPFEEEVALDPELLGKVFENLLASYNPETQTTARKATGSFYTPREIVDYMVDESLKNYLLHAMTPKQTGVVAFGKTQTDMFGNEARSQGQFSLEIPIESTKTLKTQRLQQQLDQLFANDSTENPFDTADTQLLIQALSDCTILDPACGSGAFPMGVLQRMVFLLAKLDPNNRQWKETQLSRAKRDFITADSFADDTIREQAQQAASNRIAYIEQSFERNNHELDYTRKLFLIENCIYGVDIQQIAVQIAKLRFFISLIVEQQIDETARNRGILSMPNLETKFVAANTLVKLAKPEGLISQKVEAKERELDSIRRRIFFAKRFKDKKKLKEDEAKKRDELCTALIESGFGEAAAEQKAQWNPFDIMHSAPFFDTETMFGEDLKKGFDIVIGNPPYVQIQKLSETIKQPLSQQGYKTWSKLSDLYCVFYEQGFDLLKEHGILSYITSNKWMRADYGETLRAYFPAKTNPLTLVDFGMALTFESATVLTNILIASKSPNTHQTQVCRIQSDFNPKTMPLAAYVAEKGTRIGTLGAGAWVAYTPDEYRIKTLVEAQGKPLKQWDIEINYGIKTGYNEAFYLTTEQRDALVAADPRSADIIVPLLRGENIKAYRVEWDNLWMIATFSTLKIDIEKFPAVKEHLLQFRPRLEPKPKHYSSTKPWEGRKTGAYQWFETQDNIAYYQSFKQPKIIYPNMTNSLPFYHDETEHYYCNDKAFILTGKHLKYLTAILNSSLFKFCFRNNFPELLGNTREVRKVFFEQIPIKLPPTAEVELVFSRLVDYTQWLYKRAWESPTDRFMGVYFSQILDALVFELYMPDTLASADRGILAHLGELPPLTPTASDSINIALLRSVFSRLDDRTHPVRINLFFMDSIPEIKLIQKSTQ